jgi:hypothetical protein
MEYIFGRIHQNNDDVEHSAFYMRIAKTTLPIVLMKNLANTTIQGLAYSLAGNLSLPQYVPVSANV